MLLVLIYQSFVIFVPIIAIARTTNHAMPQEDNELKPKPDIFSN